MAQQPPQQTDENFEYGLSPQSGDSMEWLENLGFDIKRPKQMKQSKPMSPVYSSYFPAPQSPVELQIDEEEKLSERPNVVGKPAEPAIQQVMDDIKTELKKDEKKQYAANQEIIDLTKSPTPERKSGNVSKTTVSQRDIIDLTKSETPERKTDTNSKTTVPHRDIIDLTKTPTEERQVIDLTKSPTPSRDIIDLTKNDSMSKKTILKNWQNKPTAVMKEVNAEDITTSADDSDNKIVTPTLTTAGETAAGKTAAGETTDGEITDGEITDGEITAEDQLDKDLRDLRKLTDEEERRIRDVRHRIPTLNAMLKMPAKAIKWNIGNELQIILDRQLIANKLEHLSCKLLRRIGRSLKHIPLYPYLPKPALIDAILTEVEKQEWRAKKITTHEQTNIICKSVKRRHYMQNPTLEEAVVCMLIADANNLMMERKLIYSRMESEGRCQGEKEELPIWELQFRGDCKQGYVQREDYCCVPFENHIAMWSHDLVQKKCVGNSCLKADKHFKKLLKETANDEKAIMTMINDNEESKDMQELLIMAQSFQQRLISTVTKEMELLSESEGMKHICEQTDKRDAFTKWIDTMGWHGVMEFTAGGYVARLVSTIAKMVYYFFTNPRTVRIILIILKYLKRKASRYFAEYMEEWGYMAAYNKEDLLTPDDIIDVPLDITTIEAIANGTFEVAKYTLGSSFKVVDMVFQYLPGVGAGYTHLKEYLGELGDGVDEAFEDEIVFIQNELMQPGPMLDILAKALETKGFDAMKVCSNMMKGAAIAYAPFLGAVVAIIGDLCQVWTRESVIWAIKYLAHVVHIAESVNKMIDFFDPVEELISFKWIAYKYPLAHLRLLKISDMYWMWKQKLMGYRDPKIIQKNLLKRQKERDRQFKIEERIYYKSVKEGKTTPYGFKGVELKDISSRWVQRMKIAKNKWANDPRLQQMETLLDEIPKMPGKTTTYASDWLYKKFKDLVLLQTLQEYRDIDQVEDMYNECMNLVWSVFADAADDMAQKIINQAGVSKKRETYAPGSWAEWWSNSWTAKYIRWARNDFRPMGPDYEAFMKWWKQFPDKEGMKVWKEQFDTIRRTRREHLRRLHYGFLETHYGLPKLKLDYANARAREDELSQEARADDSKWDYDQRFIDKLEFTDETILLQPVIDWFREMGTQYKQKKLNKRQQKHTLKQIGETAEAALPTQEPVVAPSATIPTQQTITSTNVSDIVGPPPQQETAPPIQPTAESIVPDIPARPPQQQTAPPPQQQTAPPPQQQTAPPDIVGPQPSTLINQEVRNAFIDA